jgi:hypothetical protein
MRKIVIVRSLTNRARVYAQLHLRGVKWFDSVKEVMDVLKSGERPALMAVDAGTGVDLNLGALAMSLGYGVETRGVP